MGMHSIKLFVYTDGCKRPSHLVGVSTFMAVKSLNES
jgi:hypothetical protein